MLTLGSRSTLFLAASLDIPSARSFATAARIASRRSQAPGRAKTGAPESHAKGKSRTAPQGVAETPSRAPRNDDGSAKYPLKPNVLSTRLKELCANGKIEDAVAVLKNSPGDAQNAPVWNTLIWECMKARKYSLGYKLYVDMKRRGVRPTTRTYATMFSGFSRIPRDAWSSHTKQLDHILALWSNFNTHLTSLKTRGANDSDLEHVPLATADFFTILAAAGRYQKIFDVFYALDTRGPLAPDQVVFTALFRAIGQRTSISASQSSKLTSVLELDGVVPNDVAQGSSSPANEAQSAAYQNASDARLIWRQLCTIFENNTEMKLGARYMLDSHTLAAALSVFALGKPSDQAFALELVQNHLELNTELEKQKPATNAAALPVPPTQTAFSGKLGPKRKQLPRLLTTHTLQATLRLANAMDRPRLTLQLFQQVLDLEDAARVTPTESIIDRGHVEHALRAHRDSKMATAPEDALELLHWAVKREHLGSGSKIRPQAPTYRAALLACWRSGDWRIACAVWELMSGWRPLAFKDGASPTQKTRVLRGKELNVDPGTEEMSALAVSALAASRADTTGRHRDATPLRQCLRMLQAAGVARALRGDKMNPHDTGKNITRTKLAQAVVDVVSQALPKTPKPVATEEGGEGISPTQAKEEAQWRELADFAKTFVNSAPETTKPKFTKRKPTHAGASSRPSSPYVKTDA